MREIRQSGLEGGVRSIPHSYPYQKTNTTTTGEPQGQGLAAKRRKSRKKDGAENA